MIGVAVAPHLAQPTQVQQALNAIARNAGTLLLPGAATPLAGGGFTYGNPALRNYLDSARTTLLDTSTGIDQPVGGVDDSVGARNATQATTASKPILRRGLVNQWTYSHDLSNAIWTKAAATVVGTKIVASAANTYHHVARTLTVATGTTQTWAFEVSAAEYGLMRFADTSNGRVFASVNATTGAVSLTGGADFLSATTVVMPSGRVLFAVAINGSNTSLAMCFVGYPNATTPTNWGASYLGDGVSGINVHAQALYQGTVTAQQIIDNGGIPTTTTAAASSARGNYWWQFDGSNDSFSTSITTGNEGWVCAGVKLNSAALYQSVFTTGANAGRRGVWLISDGGVWAFATNSGSGNQSGRGEASTFLPTVVEGGWNASSVFVCVNGSTTTSARAGDCTGSSSARIGISDDSLYPLNGNISATVYCPVLPSAADRALIRRFVGSLQGQAL